MSALTTTVGPPEVCSKLRNFAPAPSEGEVLVTVDGISKKFCRSLKRSLWYGLKDIAQELNPFRPNHISSVDTRRDAQKSSVLPPLRDEEFWAVRNVSLELRRGECLGLIGHNGAGKTTLLKMLNGLIKPDSGRIEMRGRVGALIALGAGFNPILTGRENIYINGSVLGLTKREIDEKIDEIVDFAEIGKFIDSPVQSYSSGMTVRLGFSVATALKPDILILDEVLAVGDFRFRMKCLDRIRRILPTTAVFFVSHNDDQIRRLCTSAVVLRNGEALFTGPIDESLEHYEALTAGADESTSSYTSEDVDAFELLSELPDRIDFKNDLEIALRVVTVRPMSELVLRVLFRDSQGTSVAEWNSCHYGAPYTFGPGYPDAVIIRINELPLRPGSYRLAIIIENLPDKRYLAQIKPARELKICGSMSMQGICQL